MRMISTLSFSKYITKGGIVMKPLDIAVSKANSYINAEKLKSAKDEFVIANGARIGKIRGPFNTIEYYMY